MILAMVGSDSRKFVFLIFIGLLTCPFIHESYAGGMEIDPDLSRGTLNLVIGNRNCIVVATDSRASLFNKEGKWVGQQDDHQKLFKITDNIIVTIAGYGSTHIEGADQFSAAASAIILQYINELNLQKRIPSYKEVKSALSFLFDFYLTSITNIKKITAGRLDPGDYEFQMLIVGYDEKQRLITKTVIKSKVQNDILISDIDTDSSKFIEIGDKFIFQSAGVEGVAEEILNNPEKYKAYPAMVNYAENLKKDNGNSLSTKEMKDIAETVLKIASTITVRKDGITFPPIGGPSQLAVFENTHLQTTFPELRPSPPPPMKYNLFTQPMIGGGRVGFSSGGGAIVHGPNTIMAYISGQFINTEIKIDNQHYFGNTIRHSIIYVNSANFSFTESNNIKDCLLIIGTKVDPNSPKVKALMSSFKWNEIRKGIVIPD